MTWAIRRAQRNRDLSLYAAVLGPRFDATRILAEVRGQVTSHASEQPDRGVEGQGAMVYLASDELSYVVVHRGRQVARRWIQRGWVLDLEVASGTLTVTYLPTPTLRHDGHGCRPEPIAVTTLSFVTDDADGLAAIARRWSGPTHG